MNIRHVTKLWLLTAMLVSGFSLTLHAQHYPAGSEGIKAGSIPSPGFYVEDYNSFYLYHQVPGFAGQLQTGFEQFTYTQTPRLMWIAPWQVLDTDIGVAARIPFTYEENTHRISAVPITPGGPTTVATESQFGLSDIEIEPLILSWHLKHFDIDCAYSFWAPTGDYPGGDVNRNTQLFYTLGQGYWTHMFTLGFTWYPDSDKTWAISLLNHYEINTSQYSGLYNGTGGSIVSEDTTLGDIYTLEWGISKSIVKEWDLGITGYYQQQVSPTEGPTPNGPTWPGERVHVAGIGPEIRGEYQKWGLSGSLRYAYEFTAMDHPEGHLITLTIGKSF